MAVAVARDLEAHVPTCPDWNVAKLTIHTGQHHRWVAGAVAGGGEQPADPPKPGLRGDELVAWFRQGWQDLADLLDSKDDDAPAWTWSREQRVGFWRRRTALETTVHRWDAENAVGDPGPLDPALAADGIDEMLFVMIAADDDYVYRGRRVHAGIVPTDAPGAWTLDLVDGEAPRADVATGSAVSGDHSVSLSGTAEDLLLLLWGRRGPETIRVGGDEAATQALMVWVKE